MTVRHRLTKLSIPLLAALAFAIGAVTSPTVDGDFAIGTAQAKGGAAKGGGAKGGAAKGGAAKAEKARGGGRDTRVEKGHGRGGGRPDKADRDPKHVKTETRGQGQGRGDAKHGAVDTSGTEESGSWGGTASQLRQRNAATANESAFENASSESNVGRIATYREAARATLDKESEIDSLNRDILDLETRRDLAEAAGDYNTADAIDADIMRLEDDRLLAEDDLRDLTIAEQDAYGAVGGPELNENDYAVFRQMLGLE
ncbi:MAG: hypothetical protein OEN23_02290 [Paracoccaceae bacterium]|nr:hypothetical protein [Paracoccaceae bacterium]